MSFHRWLRHLQSALTWGRTQRQHSRRGPIRAATHRPGLEVLEDRSVPAFLAPVDYLASGPNDVQAGDFNGDGIQDLAVANLGDSSISVLLGNGDSTFQPRRDTPASWHPLSLAVGDFNEDGKLDLATNNYYAPGIEGVTVLLGNGDGTFTHAPPVEGLFEWADSIATGDLNADGTLDLVTTLLIPTASDGYLTYVSLMIGHGDGTFASNYVAFEGAFSSSLVLADLDGDGDDDVVAGGFEVKVFPSNGDGTLQAPRDAGVLGFFLAVADFDADGNLDLAATDYANRLSVLPGNGDGTFQPAQSFAAGTNPRQINAADVNSDGVSDLVVLDQGNLQTDPPGWWVDQGLIVFLGTGDGSFGPPITTALESSPYGIGGIDVADVNADNRPDATLVRFSPSEVSVLFNDGSWSPGDPASVSIRDASATEGNTGTASAIFTVALSRATNVDVTVHYTTVDGTGTAGSDYTAASGIVIIPAGQISATVTVAVRGDRIGEPNETFVVNLTAATGASIGDGRGTGTILDNEPRISINDVTKAEGKRNKTTLFIFTVTLSAAYDQSVTVSFQTVNGTAATGDNDFVAKTGTISFNPGETTKTITIEVKGDSKRESNEYFYLDLSGNSSNSWFSKSRGIGTILNDD